VSVEIWWTTCGLPGTVPGGPVSVGGVTTNGTAPAERGGERRRLLVVEDDRAIADAVVRRLRSDGYTVDAVHDGPAAVAAAARTRYDAVVLDVMLPGLDGLEVCKRIQARDPVPVLMLTARDEEADRLVGLAVGADDYLTKPFSPRELVARVAALLRRVDRAAQLVASSAEREEGVVEAGGLAIDVGARRVSVGGDEVHLTRTEFDLLLALARRPGQVVDRDRLLTEVWDWPDVASARAAHGTAARAVDSHVKALRRKIGAARIRTVHGVGYAVEAVP
jgi:DNA-binding response OmpR family regulator